MKNGKKEINNPLKDIKEDSVLDAVKRYLEIKKLPYYRINSGALKTSRGQLVRFGAKGMSDFYVIGPAGLSVWIECKRPVGGVLSKAQKDFLDVIKEHGGVGIVVKTVESLDRQLKEAGVI
jgi:hypothetical protein